MRGRFYFQQIATKYRAELSRLSFFVFCRFFVFQFTTENLTHRSHWQLITELNVLRLFVTSQIFTAVSFESSARFLSVEIMNSFTASPLFASGIPIAAQFQQQDALPQLLQFRLDKHWPDTRIMSLIRSTIFTKPSSSITATSPVFSHSPSSVKESAVASGRFQ